MKYSLTFIVVVINHASSSCDAWLNSWEELVVLILRFSLLSSVTFFINSGFFFVFIFLFIYKYHYDVLQKMVWCFTAYRDLLRMNFMMSQAKAWTKKKKKCMMHWMMKHLALMLLVGCSKFLLHCSYFHIVERKYVFFRLWSSELITPCNLAGGQHHFRRISASVFYSVFGLFWLLTFLLAPLKWLLCWDLGMK